MSVCIELYTDLPELLDFRYFAISFFFFLLLCILFLFAVLVNGANLSRAFLLCWCGEAMLFWKPPASSLYQQDRRLQYTPPLHRTNVLNTFLISGFKPVLLALHAYVFTKKKVHK